MKKYVILFVVLICAVSLNAQDTISKTFLRTEIKYDDNTLPVGYDYNSGQFIVHGKRDTIYKYSLDVDREYVSSIYMKKAGNCFTAGGVLLGLGVCTAFLPTFINFNNENSVKILSGTGLAFGVSGIVCFIAGGCNMSKSSLVLRTTKKYRVETDGNNIKIKF